MSRWAATTKAAFGEARSVAMAGSLKHFGQPFAGVKKCFGNLSASSTMLRVVTLDPSHAVESLLHIPEGKQSLAGGKKIAKTGFLRQDGPTGGQITHAPVAEPPRI